MDAMWRLMKYETYPKSTPPVSTVKVMMPAAVKYHTSQGKWCDIAVYFSRPDCLHHLTLAEFFQSYVFHREIPMRLRNKRNCVDGYFEIFHPKVNTVSYICKRQISECIIRVQNLFITSGDIWYLRLIMVKSAVKSFEDALTDHDHNIRYSSFQAAAVAKGFVTEINQAMLCYRQHMETSYARELCMMQALKLLFCSD
jgi:hypothetical protein